jgi:hypothetical protein
MTLNNLGTNSASTCDWLEAMKNQASISVEPYHVYEDFGVVVSKQEYDSALREAEKAGCPCSGFSDLRIHELQLA